MVPKRLICRCHRVSPPITRSNRAPINRIKRGNADVAGKAPAARDSKGASSAAPAPEGAPREESPCRETSSLVAEKASPVSSGNDDVADEAPAAKDAKEASLPAPMPAAGAIAEEVGARLT